MIGLGAIAPGAKNAAPAIDPEVAKEMFAKLYVNENSIRRFILIDNGSDQETKLLFYLQLTISRMQINCFASTSCPYRPRKELKLPSVPSSRSPRIS